MTAAVTPPATSGDDRFRKLNELSCNVTLGVYRIVKGCTLFDGRNDVTDQQAASLAKSVKEYCELNESENVGLTFALNTVFIEGQVMRSSRETYYLALELGEILTSRGVNELILDNNVSHAAVEDWARTLTKAWRDESIAATLTEEGRFRGIRCKTRNIVDWFSQNANDTPSERASRLFATAVVALRATYAEFDAGKFKLSPRLKRIARRLVFELERNPLELTALALGTRSTDPAMISISTAIVASMMALHATRSRAEPTLVAVAAMISHAGRHRLARSSMGSRALSEDELDRLPASSVIALVQLGKLYPSARQWTTLSYESIWSTRAHRTGPLYRGRRSPLMLSRLLTVARTFIELLATGIGKAPLPAEEAMNLLIERATDKTERALARLLMGAVGLFPPGTLVELNTKEVAIVMSVPEKAIRYAQPNVRIVFDEIGDVCMPPVDVDLARQQAGETMRVIQSLFRANDAQAHALRGYIHEARSKSLIKTWEELPFAQSKVANMKAPPAAVQPAAPANAQPAAPAKASPPASDAKLVAESATRILGSGGAPQSAPTPANTAKPPPARRAASVAAMPAVESRTMIGVAPIANAQVADPKPAVIVAKAPIKKAALGEHTIQGVAPVANPKPTRAQAPTAPAPKVDLDTLLATYMDEDKGEPKP